MIKTVIGILSYNDKHYLKKVLPTVVSLPHCKVVILDNAHNDEVKEFLQKKFPEVTYMRHEKGNIGFGIGHNYILQKSPKSQYYFCLNNDILVEEDGFGACVKYLDDNDETCMISAKLYHWDFENDQKTTVIDTLGIVGNRAHSFWDRGQGKVDRGQYDNSIDNIFGISGAAFFFRRSDINKLHGDEYLLFDPHFFMYKEDIDLAYRLQWQGMNIAYLKNVLGYHARTVSKRGKKSYFAWHAGYMNHLIMLRNNFSSKYSLQTKLMTFLYEKLKFIFFLFRYPKICKELFNVFKIKDLHKPDRKVSPSIVEKKLLH